MTIFDDYIRNKGCCKVSKTLLWDYDLTQFDWQRSRKVVVQRIIRSEERRVGKECRL